MMRMKSENEKYQVQFNIGKCYEKINDNKKAIEFISKSVELYKQHKT